MHLIGDLMDCDKAKGDDYWSIETKLYDCEKCQFTVMICFILLFLFNERIIPEVFIKSELWSG